MQKVSKGKARRSVSFLIGWKNGRIEPLTVCFTMERAIKNARFLLSIHPEFDAIELTSPDGRSLLMVERETGV